MNKQAVIHVTPELRDEVNAAARRHGISQGEMFQLAWLFYCAGGQVISSAANAFLNSIPPPPKSEP